MMAAAEESEAGHGQSISQIHGGIQAEGRWAVQEIGHDVRRGGALVVPRRRSGRIRPFAPVGEARRAYAELPGDLCVGRPPLAVQPHGPLLELGRVLG